MEKRKIEIEFEEYASVNELNANDFALMELAVKSADKAYAPYSLFQVGAAIKLGNGTIIQGNNQENASFPVGICAERVALFYASSLHPGETVESIAITAKTKLYVIKDPIPPCGLCRQAIAEFENKQGSPIKILMAGEEGHVHVVHSISSLLPLQFQGDALKKTS